MNKTCFRGTFLSCFSFSLSGEFTPPKINSQIMTCSEHGVILVPVSVSACPMGFRRALINNTVCVMNITRYHECVEEDEDSLGLLNLNFVVVL